jgi:glutathione S-transferase
LVAARSVIGAFGDLNDCIRKVVRMLRIWGRHTSINVQKVLWCCDELNIGFDRKDVGGEFGGLNTPEYLSLNPNGRIPTIQDGAFVLWEANTIVRYLCAKHGLSTLYPEKLEARVDAERWMDWQICHILPGMVTMFFGLVRTPEQERDKGSIEAARIRTQEAWRILDTHLAKQPYVCGEAFTMADIPLGAFAYRWHMLPIERPTLPHLLAWFRRLSERPAFKKNVMLPLR